MPKPTISFAEMDVVGRQAMGHYVPIMVYGRSKEIFAANEGMAKVAVISAFPVSVRGSWFLMTAGHVLDGIDAERAKGVEFVNFRMFDGWGPDAKHKNFISFDFDRAWKIRINDEGLDYALISLTDLSVAALQANNVEPVSELSYDADWPAEFHAYALIGTPKETVKLQFHDTRSTKLELAACCLPLAEEHDPPEELIKPFPRFYGKIAVDDEHPQWVEMGRDIDGTSGGPVIGIRRDGDRLKYWVVGVQSGWYRPAKVIAACPLQVFCRALAAAVDEAN